MTGTGNAPNTVEIVIVTTAEIVIVTVCRIELIVTEMGMVFVIVKTRIRTTLAANDYFFGKVTRVTGHH